MICCFIVVVLVNLGDDDERQLKTETVGQQEGQYRRVELKYKYDF